MAHMMKKMKDLMPAGTVPKEFDVAIKRLEAGEDPEKIEQDMGDVLGDFMGGEEGGPGGPGGSLLARQRPLRHVAALCERRRIESALLSPTIAKAGQKPLNWREKWTQRKSYDSGTHAEEFQEFWRAAIAA